MSRTFNTARPVRIPAPRAGRWQVARYDHQGEGRVSFQVFRWIGAARDYHHPADDTALTGWTDIPGSINAARNLAHTLADALNFGDQMARA